MQGFFNSTSFPLHNQYDYDLMKIYQHDNLLHKNEYLLEYFQINNVLKHSNPLQY
jgi:hypothetical protein